MPACASSRGHITPPWFICKRLAGWAGVAAIGGRQKPADDFRSPLLAIFAIMREAGDSPMATMNVSLPDPMREWVETQVKTGEYANTSDYIRDLIRHDQHRWQELQ